MRTAYRNGQEIGSGAGCDGCAPAMIQGRLCHEAGCPNAWRDREVECRLCGDRFYAEGSRQDTCFECLNDGFDDDREDEDDSDARQDHQDAGDLGH